jgi:uroporphyrin-III C-methyltransferase
VIIIGWSWKSLHNVELQSTLSMNALQGKLLEEEQNVSQLQNKMSALEQKIQQQQTALDNTDTNLHQLLQNEGKDTSAYTLSEIKYLISLANLHLRFNHDVATTIVLLQAADDRASQLADPTLLDLRQALANDILSLKSLPTIDREGLLTRLNAMQEQVAKLPLTVGIFNNVGSTTANNTSSEKGWKHPFRAMGDAFKQLITIRHRDPKFNQLIAPDQELYLREYINLLFEQARWAVLQGDVAVYISSLQQAKVWLSRYFVSNTNNIQQLLDLLSTMQVTPINANLPDLSHSLIAIDQAIKQHNTAAKTIVTPIVPKPPTTQIQSRGESA